MSLSEQQLVDCTYNDGSDGCNGGWMPDCFDYLAQNGGSVETYLYPYAGVAGTCVTNRPAKVKVQSYVKIKTDETSIKNAIMQYGSLAICVDADQWSYYGSGIFKASRVAAVTNHAVNLVGWGFDTAKKQPYWLIRNSWGSTWGENGYIRVATTKSGTYNPKETFAVNLAY